MKITKKDYYKKSKRDCPCCGWRGCSSNNRRKWLGHRERLKRLDAEMQSESPTNANT